MDFGIDPFLKNNAGREVKVMVYTLTHIFWGKLEIGENQIPERLLTGANVPETVFLKNCKYIFAKHMGSRKPEIIQNVFIPTNNIIGFHLMEDEQENPTPEPNWVKKDVIILLGIFRISTSLWVGPQTDIHRHLEITKSQFIDFSNPAISIPELKELKPITAKKISIKKDDVVFLVE